MRLTRAVAAMLVVATLASTPAFATTDVKMLELRGLLGDWIGRSNTGEMVHASFRLSPDGRVLQYLRGHHTGIVSVYGTPETSVLRTSTAPAQPAAVVPASARKAPRTSAQAPDKVSFVVADAGHHTETWTWRRGSRVRTAVFYFTRDSEMF
jgi:hypothetical protein